MLINLWIKDKRDGNIHQVGTDVHDSIIFMDGAAQYYNLQNGSGTLGDTPDGYEFVEPPDLDDFVSVTPDELYFNRKLIHRDLMKKLRKLKKEKRKHKKRDRRKNKSLLVIKNVIRYIGYILLLFTLYALIVLFLAGGGAHA